MTAVPDRLRADLTDLAEQVTVVDLRPGTLRAARRLGRRRAALGAAAALAVLAVTAGTAFAVRPQRDAAPPPAGASPSVTAPSPPTPDALPGMYLYRTANAPVHELWYRPSGGQWSQVGTASPPYRAAAQALSPDRQGMAWISDGQVKLADPHGGGVRAVTAVDSPACGRIGWTGDSRRIVFGERTAGGTALVVVNLDGTGRHTIATGLQPEPCLYRLAASRDGRLVGIVAGGKAVLLRVDGGGQRVVPATLPARQVPERMIAVTGDGGRVLVATMAENGCCTYRYFALDAVSGRAVELGEGGTAPMTGAFAPDGRIVLIVDRNGANGAGVDPELTVFDPNGTVLGHADLPPFEGGYLLTVDDA